MMMTAENTMEKRAELKVYNIMVDCTDCHTIIVFRFEQELAGTDRQVDYARSILANKVFKVNEVAGMMLSNRRMTSDEYHNGIASLINELSSLTDAKYIIEHVK